MAKLKLCQSMVRKRDRKKHEYLYNAHTHIHNKNPNNKKCQRIIGENREVYNIDVFPSHIHTYSNERLNFSQNRKKEEAEKKLNNNKHEVHSVKDHKSKYKRKE